MNSQTPQRLLELLGQTVLVDSYTTYILDVIGVDESQGLVFGFFPREIGEEFVCYRVDASFIP